MISPMLVRITTFQPGWQKQAGLTLIELLVSLVILGFVVTIMSGAFYQVAQVVRIAENVNGNFQGQWVRLNALRDLVANLALPKNVEKPFTGNDTSFEAYTLAMPQGDWGQVTLATATLKPNADGGTDLSISAENVPPLIVASWKMPVVMEYQTIQGTMESIWPPMSGKAEDGLPRAVVIRAKSGEQRVQMLAVYDGIRKPESDGTKDLARLLGIESK
jgi:prepilin-type N-terminal cleavage/methylation domain-containing protein